MIDANIEVLKRYNVKKILATCPHCFNTLKNEYPDFGFKAEEVIHHTEFIDRLIQSKKISVETNPESMKVVFHDSCYLGRYNDVYDAPRSALRSVGAEVVEMPRTKSKGLCCGAGGARMWMEEKIGKRINIERAEEALATEPQVIAAGCPFCQVMLNDGVTAKGQGDKVRVLDVAEIVAERVKL
jgi:Fe-S oxidoreductase